MILPIGVRNETLTSADNKIQATGYKFDTLAHFKDANTAFISCWQLSAWKHRYSEYVSLKWSNIICHISKPKKVWSHNKEKETQHWCPGLLFFFSVKVVCESHHSVSVTQQQSQLWILMCHITFSAKLTQKNLLPGEGGFNVTHKDIKRIFYSIVLFKSGSLGCECTVILDQRDAGDFSRSLSSPITPAAAVVQLLGPTISVGSVSSNQLLSIARFYFPNICHAALFFENRLLPLSSSNPAVLWRERLMMCVCVHERTTLHFILFFSINEASFSQVMTKENRQRWRDQSGFRLILFIGCRCSCLQDVWLFFFCISGKQQEDFQVTLWELSHELVLPVFH